MKDFDQDFVRAQFPAFNESTLEGFAHFENAGGSYACGPAITALDRFYRESKVQPYHHFAPSKRGGELMDQAKQRMAGWLNVGEDEVHFGPSTSANSYTLAHALREHLAPGDEVIVTNQDHEANIGAWRRLEKAGIVVREWCVNPATAELEIAGLEALLGERTRAVAFTHCSNVVASINPVREITDLVHRAGAIAIVDGVSFAPHGLPDVRELGADVYFFSLYKVYGPHLGVMVLSRELNDTLPHQGHFFNADKPAYRFTPAGPDHAQIAAVNGVMDYLDALHDHHFEPDESDPAERSRSVSRLLRARETELLQPLLDFIADREGTRLIGRRRADERAPTVAFSSRKHASQEIASNLAAMDIGVGAGDFYGYRLVEALGYDMNDGVVRASFVHYTSPEEIQRLIEALDTML
ncbi:MAG: aminotransferase class V-fold PLP-dependent enzyme [Xanthomonadales bacterium]|nr:aminotransferase class V-fold PLP-dependent enzyme [Gammaproteobacteria bacterium]MBT8050755.1 aminotransferase class V-fold PLP-dependent enzyme [Gammaproteobacteria bacterium]MBT8055607.1 aminotransferase class V-fold PLP-dependent enzyme [Gammaproteobacteria bacterium]NNJ80049.1 aminotransferase class V-fold PLP-dependent enzyme [Xanthomonadales bacterium]NNL03977.1 aminotransferase class V-fold PLP-dependent enzyme [Xanthomonadales bacterium]